MPAKKKSSRKNPTQNYLVRLLIAFVVIISFIILGHLGYKQFAIWDATSVPNQDHSWYNKMLLPLTPTVSDEFAYEMLQTDPSIVHIDVRDASEYSTGHIPGAINIPEQTLHEVITIRYRDKNQLIYLNCNTGHKGAVSTRLLRSMGYTNAWNIEGGLDEWKSLKYPVEVN